VDSDQNLRLRETADSRVKDLFWVACALGLYLELIQALVKVVADMIVNHTKLHFLFCLYHVLLFLLKLFILGRVIVMIDFFKLLLLIATIVEILLSLDQLICFTNVALFVIVVVIAVPYCLLLLDTVVIFKIACELIMLLGVFFGVLSGDPFRQHLVVSIATAQRLLLLLSLLLLMLATEFVDVLLTSDFLSI